MQEHSANRSRDRRRVSTIVLLALFAPLVLSAQNRRFTEFPNNPPKAGDIAPDFTLQTLEGATFTLSEAYATRPVVMEFGSFT